MKQCHNCHRRFILFLRQIECCWTETASQLSQLHKVSSELPETRWYPPDAALNSQAATAR
jgi:hypothetical protein